MVVELRDLARIEAESIGWVPLADSAYLLMGVLKGEEIVITVTGISDTQKAGMHVLLMG